MLALAGRRSVRPFTVTRGVTRPVWEPNAKTHGAVRDRETASPRPLGIDLPHESSGGGSDANFTGALGMASLDGLGVCGSGAHTLDEHILVDSLPVRGEADDRAADGAVLTAASALLLAPMPEICLT